MRADRDVVLTWRNLHLADEAVRRILDRRLARDVGCSLLEHDLLDRLAAEPRRRLQMLELADLLGVTRGGLTRIVDRLAARGWIERARTIYLGVLKETLGTCLNKEERGKLARIASKLLDALAGRDPVLDARAWRPERRSS